MKKFSKFLESKGISNDIINFNNEIYNEVKNGNFNFKIDLIGKEIKLINLEINIVFNDTEISYFNPFYSKFKDEYLYNCLIYISLNKIQKLKEKLSHELTHTQEYYNLRKNESKLNFNIKIKPNYKLVQTSISKISFDNVWDDFKYLIYLSLDSEYNSRVSQLYDFIKNLNSLDESYLLDKLTESESYKKYKKLDNFDPILFLNESEKLIGKNSTIIELNRLNEIFIENEVNKLDGYKFIKKVNEENVLNYLLNWKKLFTRKNNKHIKKLKRIIKKVIEDLEKPLDERFDTMLKNEIEFLKKYDNKL